MAYGAPAFQPNVAELVLAAFARIGVRRTEITNEHMVNARVEANLLQVEWGNEGPNLWTVDNQSIVLVPGQAVYDIDPITIEILDAYISEGLTAQPYDANNDANTDAAVFDAPVLVGGVPQSWTDRSVTGVSRTDFVQQPDKQRTGMPSIFWFQKAFAPKIYFWPVPAAASVFNYWRVRQIQDADASNGGSSDIPYLWLDAGVAGLAHRLARIYAPAVETIRAADARDAWTKAATQDTEQVPLYFTPDLSGYYR